MRTDVPPIPNSPITQTDFGYTGQRSLSMGLMDYHARMSDAYLNQWTQPDTIIPDPSNPQSWNRYSYAVNNPIRYNDPSGHCPVCIVALVGLAIILSQVPSDMPQSNPERWGDPNVVVAGLTVTIGAPDIVGMAGEGLMGLGKLVNSPKLWATGYNAYNAATTSVAAADLAKKDQMRRGYLADEWENVTLPKGTKVLAGEPGQSPYYTPMNTMNITGNDATKIFKGLQVPPSSSAPYPYRPGMTAYELSEDTAVARSTALANAQISKGGLEQYFIPNFNKVLQPLYTILLKNFK